MRTRTQKKEKKSQRGVATIPVVLLFATLVVVVGASIAVLSYSETITAQGSYLSVRALTSARAGAYDALERIARNKNYSCATTDCYSLDLASGGCTDSTACAKVSVSAGVGTAGDPKIIISKGIANASVRTVKVTVQLDTNQNGQISSAEWQEVTQ